jgi:AraC family transcriptional regulator
MQSLASVSLDVARPNEVNSLPFGVMPRHSVYAKRQASATGDAKGRTADICTRDAALFERMYLAMSTLMQALDSAISGNNDSAERAISRAAAILKGAEEIADSAHRPSRQSEAVRGGLAPWQIRRITTFIDANLDGKLRTADLAKLVGLSTFHFIRAFGESFGHPPHRYVMRRRVQRAQGLMLTTAAPLGQIALECGLADQTHFSKLFSRVTGESPASWRRARTGPLRGPAGAE